ncbi:MAG: putative cytokinin riboside 5'-monophosphate phosphoribohydrolase [Chroococcidiopsis sp. SAG 2025]|uniref:LOG family protein n=1 Tax=Chroococcidiopsis sp. SAG 2025 TaxID=171389 RepID=UPI0029370CA8|nr:TIGR00730 family Rossman fold protein [Chroococcidiopsis sp. SAG 2025]MDV2992711.1 putative cytokinin riboside 5'-monophosphate phosphoribohydrolase [Chroococcidiopsis sp. SAG 2025]
MESICIFCGSSTGNRSIYQEAAQAMGEAIARRGLSLVYGGGNVGLMGMVADAALAAGGEVIGVIPKFLVDKEIAHNGLTQLHVVDSMHDRKALMTELADAFIALPGGYGTLEEFCEILTWAQLGLHQKPQGLLNVEGYYDPLLQLFDRAVTEGFLKSELRALVLESSVPEDLLNLLASYQPITVEKWLRQDTEV